MAEANAALNQEPSNETTTETNTDKAGTPRPLSLLAKELFGPEFHGEVTPEKKEPEKTEPEEKTETETSEQKTDEETKDEKQETEEVPISSLSELIEHNEWDPDWVNSLKVPIKVDGEQGEVSLKDLTASYQTQQAAEKRLADAKAKAKAQTEELTRERESLQAQYAAAAGLIQKAEKLLDADSQAIDWNQLRKDDPAEYSARKAEHAERKQIIEGMKREAQETYRKAVLEQNQKTQEQLRAALEVERNALLEKLPEWRTPEKAKAGQAELSDYLKSQGFTDQDIATAYDHRLVLIARKAMLFDKGQNKVSTALKKVAKVPKVLKPGSPKPQDQQSKERVEKLHANLRQSGRIEDAAALLKARRSK